MPKHYWSRVSYVPVKQPKSEALILRVKAVYIIERRERGKKALVVGRVMETHEGDFLAQHILKNGDMSPWKQPPMDAMDKAVLKVISEGIKELNS